MNMKTKPFVRKALLGLAGALVAATAFANPEVGQPAPGFSVIDTQGQTHTLEQYQGSTVVLEWTNHDCPFVVKHYATDNMQSLQREMSDHDVVWLTVISSAPGTQGHVSPDQADELTSSRNAAPHAVLLDEDGVMGRAYAARVTPHMYVIDATVSAAVENMLELLLLRPWTADLLAQEDERLFMGGGEAQGVKPGMRFDVMTKGQQVRSSTTDALC